MRVCPYTQYDVLFEVDTEELTEELYRVGQFEGTTQLLVESHEEGWLAKHFVEADGKRPLQVSHVSRNSSAGAVAYGTAPLVLLRPVEGKELGFCNA
eukprot:1119210-Pelagomonas_calceolata.AAC.1